MKKITALLLSIVMMLAFATSAQAEAKPVSVWFNNEEIPFGNQAPIIEKGTTLVPVRAFLEKLGFEIGWDDEHKVVTASKNSLSIVMQINNTTALVNDEEHTLTVAPKIVNKNTLVPLRFIAETAGYEVSWDQELRLAAIVEKEASRGFLWKVEQNGNTVYLLGSIHVANEAMYPLRAEIEDAFAQADHLAVEVDITKGGDPEIQQFVEKIATYQDGTTLPDHISKETYELLGEVLTEMGLPANALDHVKVWNVSNSLSYLKMANAEFDAGLGIDLYFMTRALESGLPILELETYQSQLEMFDGFSKELQESLLVGTLQSFSEESEEASGVDMLSQMWVTGDEKLLTAMTEDVAQVPEYYKAMIEDRNIAMVDKIQGYLNSKEPTTYFVVVGALHMVGKHGIVTLLQQQGLTVEQQ